MLLGEESRLDELLVRVLSEHPGLTLEELTKAVKSNGCKRSVKALYKELARLRKTGVIMRHDRRYTLQLGWVFEMLNYAQNLSQKYLREGFFDKLLPSPGQKLEWRFRDLTTLDVFWTQMVITLVKNSTESAMFEWLPHPWFILLTAEPEIRLQRAITKLGKKVHIIIGSDRYLDKLAEKYFNPRVYAYRFDRGFMTDQQSVYYDVIDNWVLTVKLPSSLVATLETLYRQTGSAKEVNIAEIIRVLQQPASIKLSLEHNQPRAARIKKQFIGRLS